VEILIPFVVSLFSILLGFFFGRRAERRHFADLRIRERMCEDMVATQLKGFLAPARFGKSPKLIMAETVIASDYLKSFLAKLQNIFGGEVKSFVTLLERGRREVTIQLKEKAAADGYNAICNLRLNTADVGGMNARAVTMASVLGWATAYNTTLAPPPTDPPTGAATDPFTNDHPIA
jgi:uncharacterized protein YbjQ (UPF0145 family)